MKKTPQTQNVQGSFVPLGGLKIINSMSLNNLCWANILEQTLYHDLFGTEWLIPGTMAEIINANFSDGTTPPMTWISLKCPDKGMGCQTN